MKIELTRRTSFNIQDIAAVFIALAGGLGIMVNGAAAVLAILAALFLEVVNVKVPKEPRGAPHPGTYGSRGVKRREVESRRSKR